MTVEQRLERLERANRWMRRIGAVGVAVVAIMLLVGQEKGGLKIIEAQTIRLRDDRGQVRAELSTAREGTALVFTDDAGEPAVVLGVANDVSSLALARGGKDRFGITVVEDKTVLTFRDNNAAIRLVALCSADKTQLAVKDSDGNVIWRAPGE